MTCSVQGPKLVLLIDLSFVPLWGTVESTKHIQRQESRSLHRFEFYLSVRLRILYRC